MAKPHRPPSPPPPAPVASRWPAFLFGALLGAVLGATATYVLRPAATPARTPAAGPAPVSAATAPSLAAVPPLPPLLPAGALPGPGAGNASPADAERTRANFFYDQQNWPEAIRGYEAALRLGSDDADLRTDLGNAYRFTGRREDALAQYELAQRMNPAHEFSLFNQGGLFLDEYHDPARAVAAWRAYLARFPQGRNVTIARALIQQHSGPAPPPAAASGAAPAGASSANLAPPAPANPAAPRDATEERLFRLVRPPAPPPAPKPGG